MKLTEIERHLLLSYLPETGPAAYWALIQHFSDLGTALAAPASRLAGLLKPAARSLLEQVRRSGGNHPLLQRVRADLEWLAAHQVHLVSATDSRYPVLLKEIVRPPPLLYVLGNVDALSMPQMAVVGSRKPTRGGRQHAEQFAAELARGGLTVTSGLALGVDIAAHQGALDADGQTVAVLATGIDTIYPHRHRQAAADIATQGGALVTEFPLGTPPQPAHFPQRNRVISGLSFGVLVVEAALKSGSLITARYALAQNREVFAIPGSIHNPLSRGCHALLRDGAKLVETAQDILEELPGFLSLKWQESQPRHKVPADHLPGDLDCGTSETELLSQLDYDPVSLDTLVEKTGSTAGEVLAALLTLELKGLVLPQAGGYVRHQS